MWREEWTHKGRCRCICKLLDVKKITGCKMNKSRNTVEDRKIDESSESKEG